MTNAVKVRNCRFCGAEYPVGLFNAHLLVAHQTEKSSGGPDAPRRCSICRAKVRPSRRSAHMKSPRHREARVVRLQYNPVPLVTAYVRGDRVADIISGNGITPPDLYEALRLFDVPLRGNHDDGYEAVQQRNVVARMKGNRWHTVRRLRAKGKSWLEIEQALSS